MFKKLRRVLKAKTSENNILDKKKESAYFPKLKDNKDCTRLYLVIGPESTATRLITKLLSQHPNVVGTLDASEHVDVLDDVWRFVENGEFQKAKDVLPTINKGSVFVTRRSMPHSLSANKPAEYLNFPDIYSFYKFCSENRISLYLFVTSRSPVPTYVSSVNNRDSVSKSLKKAKFQNMASYMFLFEAIIKLNLPFSLISLEALLNDKANFINSLFEIMGLDKSDLELDLHEDINLKKYDWYTLNKEL